MKLIIDIDHRGDEKEVEELALKLKPAIEKLKKIIRRTTCPVHYKTGYLHFTVKKDGDKVDWDISCCCEDLSERYKKKIREKLEQG